MGQELLQERIIKAEKAMEEAQADYDEAKEAFTEDWKSKNPNGSKAELFRYLKEELKDFLAPVESWRSTYNELVKKMPDSVAPLLRLDEFLANTLKDVGKNLVEPPTTGTPRSYPKTPKIVKRWEGFKIDASNFTYPTIEIGNDVTLPPTRGLQIKLESDVDKIIGNHLDNFNRVFLDQGSRYQFARKADAFPAVDAGRVKFIGRPDHVLILGDQVLSFVEDKTPKDLPVRHRETGQLFDLLEIYKDDIAYKDNKVSRGNIGRTDVSAVIDQVYGYIALNNLIYGCLTCYDTTYFLWRPERGTLLISDPIYNNLRSPTLLQALYYFSNLVIQGHETGKQQLDPSPKQADIPMKSDPKERGDAEPYMETGEFDSDSGSNYSTKESNKRFKTASLQYNLNLESLRYGTYVGEGATGQVIRLKDSDIVVKCCDSYNNPEGFKMLQNEILIYQKLSSLNEPLNFVPKYYGECEIHGQYFIALEFISGKPCDWRGDRTLNMALMGCLKELKSRCNITHQDLRPENVLLTAQGDIKLIDFGKAEMVN